MDKLILSRTRTPTWTKSNTRKEHQRGTGSYLNQIESKRHFDNNGWVPSNTTTTTNKLVSFFSSFWNKNLASQRIKTQTTILLFIAKDKVSFFVSFEVKQEREEWWVMWRITVGKDGREIAYGVQLQHFYVASVSSCSLLQSLALSITTVLLMCAILLVTTHFLFLQQNYV